MSTAYITHRQCQLHDMGDEHPEASRRLRAIDDALLAQQLYDFLRHFDAPVVTTEQLLRVHPQRYLDSLEALVPTDAQGIVVIDDDTIMNSHSLAAAKHAAGAGVLAVDKVMSAEVRNAFCAVRPPGHHAEREEAMGFCFYGNIVVAAKHALDHHGLSRVAIVDFDVHHGNGTEDLVESDPRILFCSSFEQGAYPDRYRDNLPGQRINTPLPRGAAGPEIRFAVQQSWLPALDQFQPEMVFVSAGFDAHVLDPMADLDFIEDDYRWLSETLLALADKHCGGRLVSMLEGGYDPAALGRCVTAHIRPMMGL